MSYQFTKTKFFEKFGNRLVKVNPENDVETGEFQLFSSEEAYIASDYLKKGYDIASVFEILNGEDVVVIDNDCSPSHHKIGFFVINR